MKLSFQTGSVVYAPQNRRDLPSHERIETCLSTRHTLQHTSADVREVEFHGELVTCLQKQRL